MSYICYRYPMSRCILDVVLWVSPSFFFLLFLCRYDCQIDGSLSSSGDWILSSPLALKLQWIGKGLNEGFTRKPFTMLRIVTSFPLLQSLSKLRFYAKKKPITFVNGFLVAGTGLEPATFGL